MFLLRLINYKFHKILTTIMKMLFVFSNQRDARNRICSNFQNKLTSIYASMMINLQSRILHQNQLLLHWMVKRANTMMMAPEEKKHAIKTKFYIAMNKTFTRKLISPQCSTFSLSLCQTILFCPRCIFFSLPLFFHFLCTQTFLLCFYLILNSFVN